MGEGGAWRRPLVHETHSSLKEKRQADMLETGTVVALATPEGTGGLAIIRLSGPEAVSMAKRVFSGPGFLDDLQSHRMVYGILHSPDYQSTIDSETGYEIDHCLAVALLGTRSFTGEDTVEFHCHGGREVARQALTVCREVGARPAEPGEFTARAFFNGKIDLAQAEAVNEIIVSSNKYQHGIFKIRGL